MALAFNPDSPASREWCVHRSSTPPDCTPPDLDWPQNPWLLYFSYHQDIASVPGIILHAICMLVTECQNSEWEPCPVSLGPYLEICSQISETPPS